ncbi:Choline/ethanolaminephosphotransferase 2 [Porphyridium purpureum]|uniref:Choline/ethanolaminephosphotransferase 2 n=1 Tax=Porphyridium purpureum TaxID=35688 RepID=A0A5J4Z5M6_PORPP|nr:Choline/ethanolaminephosphotransferase 2 [Porphyridium purpureum]|eukprot:POR6132..scf295_1
MRKTPSQVFKDKLKDAGIVLPKLPPLEDQIWYKNYFSEPEIRALCNYKNSGADYSLAYRYILNPCYHRLVHKLPLWLAPNVVTLLGLCAVLSSALLAVYFSPDLQTDQPWWVYVLSAVGLSFYQTMDNLDGKQARRTGSSSPLGHLFDHGCDALNVTITGMNVANTLQLGNSLWSFSLVFWMGYFVFYTATLEEFFTSSLTLREINGPNEGLLVMQGLHLLTAVVGPSIWRTPLKALGFEFPLGRVFVFSAIPLALPTAFMNYRTAMKAAPSLFAVCKASVPLVFFTLYAYMWGYFSPTVMLKYPVGFFAVVGLAFFYIVSRMIISHLTNSQYPWFIPMLTPLGVGAVNALLGHYRSSALHLHELPLLIIGGVVELVFNVRRVYCMTRQICNYLDIYCFRIKQGADSDRKAAVANGKHA